MKVLVLNCGSSSLKFQLYNMGQDDPLAGGLVDRIGNEDASLKYEPLGGDKLKEVLPVKDHQEAIDLVLKTLCDSQIGKIHDPSEIDTVGHRVVHGAEAFTGSVLINEAVLQKLKDCIKFAPLHNPPNILGIQASLWLMPAARQVAVFDTAFHQTMEPEAYLYALPYEYYEEKGIRRYGFHGTSHRYVAHKAAELIGTPIEDLKIVTCHLGNGASIAAVDGGKSVDTSMGFTPLEGLAMGTRCGDLDPAIPLFIMEEDGLTAKEMDTILNKKSGMFGMTQGFSDMRHIEDGYFDGKPREKLCQIYYSRRITKYIGAYAAIMGGLDCIVFTAGVGENSPITRKQVCESLGFMGVELDDGKNETRGEMRISKGPTHVLMVPTNEELAIALEAKMILDAE
ncbi:acetate kinase [bacterium]|nr:acetate kinase [bacterium]